MDTKWESAVSPGADHTITLRHCQQVGVTVLLPRCTCRRRLPERWFLPGDWGPTHWDLRTRNKENHRQTSEWICSTGFPLRLRCDSCLCWRKILLFIPESFSVVLNLRAPEKVHIPYFLSTHWWTNISTSSQIWIRTSLIAAPCCSVTDIVMFVTVLVHHVCQFSKSHQSPVHLPSLILVQTKRVLIKCFIWFYFKPRRVDVLIKDSA